MPNERPLDTGEAMHACASRRTVLAGACGAGLAVALGGCATYGGSAESQPAATQAPASPSTSGPAPSGSAPAAGGAPALAQVADIPVGGGKIFKQQKVVITQPAAGTIKAYSVTCTHQGCEVSEVKGGTINCECHGSKFRVADGSVANGPATQPLPAVAVTVAGNAITLA